MSTTTDDNAGGRLSPLLGLVVLSALCALVISYVVHAVRGWLPQMGSVVGLAVVVWLALVVVGIGGAWVLRRALAD